MLSLVAWLTFCGVIAESTIITAPQPVGDAELLLRPQAQGYYTCIYPSAHFLPILPSGGIIEKVALRIDKSLPAGTIANLRLQEVNMATAYRHEPVYSRTRSANQWRNSRTVLNSAELKFKVPNEKTIWIELKEPYTYFPEEGALALSFRFLVESERPLLLDASEGYGVFTAGWEETLAPALSVAFSVSPFSPPTRPVITSGREEMGSVLHIRLENWTCAVKLGVMARKIRVQFPGAIYHVMSRGDRREAIFLEDVDRQDFLKTLAECCRKTDFQVHAYCLMSNHFHLILETPEPNLVDGMRWLLSTYTIRLNHRHKLFGHVFSGRYKSVLVQHDGGDYFRTACDYVHLNPVRAKLLSPHERMLSYPWSSLGWYLAGPPHRPGWIRTDRLLRACGLADTAAAREQFETCLEERRQREADEDQWRPLREGWCFGEDAFKERFLTEMDEQIKDHHPGEIRRESAEVRAERIIAEELRNLGWNSADLGVRLKTDPDKLRIGQRLRAETILPMKWIAARLHLGTTRNADTRLQELRRRQAEDAR